MNSTPLLLLVGSIIVEWGTKVIFWQGSFAIQREAKWHEVDGWWGKLWLRGKGCKLGVWCGAMRNTSYKIWRPMRSSTGQLYNPPPSPHPFHLSLRARNSSAWIFIIRWYFSCPKPYPAPFTTPFHLTSPYQTPSHNQPMTPPYS